MMIDQKKIIPSKGSDRLCRPQTGQILQRNRFEKLYQEGLLDDPHLDAADEIHQIMQAFHASLIATRHSYEPRIGDRVRHTGSNWHFRAFSPDLLTAYEQRYRPWADLMTRTPARSLAGLKTRPGDRNSLEFIWDVLVDLPVISLTEKYRLQLKGQRYWKSVIRQSLNHYALVAGWVIQEVA